VGALLVGLLFGALSAAAGAQTDATLDLLDGETLYEGGWLVTLGHEHERRDQLATGWHTVADPANRRREIDETVLGVHWGLRHDLQLSLLLPYVENTVKQDVPGQPGRLHTSGFGDVTALAKWRFYRWDAPGEALNVALLFGAGLPTGQHRERSGGVLVPLELQPGTGTFDPLIGVAATYEPRRWRFNAAASYQHAGENHDDRLGDELTLELAAGNRFWLEPYPGPFARADLFLRHYRVGSSRTDGADDPDSGRDLSTVGLNLAFRPRPTLDLQASLEVPVAEHVDGTQLRTGTTFVLNFGYRF
jgi:hypothetical protein